MKFTKMQGIGNDYVYINCFEESVEDPAELARKVSDRHFGIGSDGLILICPSETADCRMRMFNADGSESQMCGNGIRCVGKYVYDHHLVDKTEFDVETGAGIKHLKVKPEHGRAVQITVDLGVPEITSQVPELIRMEGKVYPWAILMPFTTCLTLTVWNFRLWDLPLKTMSVFQNARIPNLLKW